MIPWRLLLLAYTAVQLTFTHWPPDGLPGAPFPFFDKAVHLIGYAIWGFLAARVGPRPLPWLLAGLALGAVDELTQPYFSRHADIADWLADAAGLVLGLGLGHTWSRRR